MHHKAPRLTLAECEGDIQPTCNVQTKPESSPNPCVYPFPTIQTVVDDGRFAGDWEVAIIVDKLYTQKAIRIL